MLQRVRVAVALIPFLLGVLLAQDASMGTYKPATQRPAPVSTLPYDTALGAIVFVSGTVNGHSASLLFDTGGRGSLNLRWTKAVKLESEGGYQASGSGPATVQARMVPHSTWKFGSAALQTSAVVFDLSDLEAIFGRNIDGIAGTDFLAKYVVEIDPSAQQFRIFDPGTYQPIPGATAVNLDFDQDGYAGAQAALKFGDKLASGLFMIDSGSNGAVDAYPSFAAQHGLPVHAAELDEISSGLGGNRNNRFERATAVRLGGFELREPVVAFTDADDVYSRQHYAGLIGGEILQRFVVAFDFPRKQMYLSALPWAAAPFPYDGSGIRLRAEGFQFERVIVSRVVAGSPAAAAGVKPGDTVLQVNGKNAGSLGLEQIRSQFRRAGTVDLLLQRDEATIKAQFVLKPLL